MNPEITKIIDQYLAGELSEKDQAAFEERLKSNPKLQEEVALQQDVVEGIKRSAQRMKIKQTRRNYFRSKFFKWGTISLASIIAASVLTYLIVSFFSSQIDPLPQELLEELDSEAQFEGIHAQYFQIPEEGGIVMTADGVLLSIPANAFLKDGKPYSGESVVQFQEAMNADDIVTGGLSTMSGDRLLETQGMFSLQSYTKEGDRLEVNPKVGVYVQAPVDGYKTDMQLFSGAKDANGNVDWQNPKPLYKLPVPVDMADLDFYPVEYEPYLNKNKWDQSKDARDSLYLSFEEYFQGETAENNIQAQKDYLNGYALFKNNCASCHSIYQDGTGPPLSNTRNLWNKNAGPDQLYRWVRNASQTAESSEWALQRSQLKATVQPKMDLSNNDIDLIFDYIDNSFTEDQAYLDYLDEELQMIDNIGKETEYSDLTDSIIVSTAENGFDTAYESEAATDNDYILPSKVLGFWNKKFNNTNLATRAFEKRMRAIHPTCNGVVLDKYVSQLNKPLSEIDKQVAAMGYPEFEQFAAENIGKIDVSNPHLENLQQFYSSAVDQFKKKAKKNRNKEKKRRKKWDQNTQKSREKENKRRVYRETQALQEEYQFNLKNVKRQINASVGFTIKHSPVGTVYNIDKYVWDATVNRESMDMKDPVTGKRVKITYNDFSFNVPNHEDYVKLYAYVFPHELNSYQRIEGKNGQFSYPLNDDILYDIGVVGITENGYEYYQKQTFKKGELGDITMKKTSEEQLKLSIKQLNKKRRGKTMPIGDEIQWLIRERKDYKEQKLRKEMEKFRQELSGRIYPCMEMKISYK
ncbi:MAG: c-type cytochrome [Crocinitomicaceae bacterium]